MRVLHVINGEYYSGAERVQDLLAVGLRQLGYAPAFACVKPGIFPQKRVAKEIPLHETPMSSRFDMRAALRLAGLIRMHRYSIVHTHTPRGAIVGRLASTLTRVPMIHHVHSPTTRDSERFIANFINAASERVSLLGVERIITVSNSVMEYMADQGFGVDRLRVVHNGVPTIGPLHSRGVPAGEWTIGVVALFRPRKGLEVLLQALSNLIATGHTVKLLAVGAFVTPEYRQAIMNLSASLNLQRYIEWAGFCDQVNQQLAKMDLFVLPSLYGEGLPMVVLEAMAMGVPTIASSVEGIPEIIAHGRTGLLVPPGDPTALADEISGVIKGRHDWGSLRENAHRIQAEGFSDRAMSQGVARVYREVLKDVGEDSIIRD